MIAIKKEAQTDVTEEPGYLFMELLPQIERYLRREFRHLKGDALEEAMAEATANCFVAFVRLCERGRHNQAFASSLARFAARQFNSGRKVGGRLNIRDPLSRHAQLNKGITVERYDRFDSETREWVEPFVQDLRASILDLVVMRIDVPAWLASLSRAKQKVAKDLAMGCSTNEVARRHKLSCARISQMRKELCESWNKFHEKADDVLAVA